MFQIRTQQYLGQGAVKFDRSDYNLGDDIPAPEAIHLEATSDGRGIWRCVVGGWGAGAGVNNILLLNYLTLWYSIRRAPTL